MKIKILLLIILSSFSGATFAKKVKSSKLSKKSVRSIIEADELVMSALDTNEKSIEKFVLDVFKDAKSDKDVRSILNNQNFKRALKQEIEMAKDILVTDEPDFEYVEVLEEESSCYQCVS